MISYAEIAIAASSAVLRLLCYLYLQWFPGFQLLCTLCIAFASYIGSYTYRAIYEPGVSGTAQKASAGNSNGASDKKRRPDPVVHGGNNSETIEDWTSLLLGAFHRTSKNINLANIAINVACLMFVMDFIFRWELTNSSDGLAFARVGAVSDSGARFTVRNPDGENAILLCLSRDASRTQYPQCETAATVRDFGPFKDFVTSAQIAHLRPATKYYWKAMRTVDAYELDPKIVSHGEFKTAPVKGTPSKFSFMTSSCIIPGWPYSGPWTNPLHIQGFEYMDSTFKTRRVPDFLMLLGDFIYYNIPYTPIGHGVDSFFTKYRRVYESPSYRKIYEKLPTMHVYDDHEIANNWDHQEQFPWGNAMSAFGSYQHGSNPDAVDTPREIQTQGNVEPRTYYTFEYGDVSFFLLDTRRYRSHNTVRDAGNKTMLGKDQLNSLLSWIYRDQGNGAWKFIISSVPFTKNWHGVDGHLDTWGGFLSERQVILDAVEETQSNVVVISGDRHEFAATQISNENVSMSEAALNAAGKVHEFSVSPLNMFWLPFPTYYEAAPSDELVQGLSKAATDTMIKYWPQGNSKYGIFDVDTADAGRPKLDFTLVVNGAAVWNYTIYGKGREWLKGGSMVNAFHTDEERIGAKIMNLLSKVF